MNLIIMANDIARNMRLEPETYLTLLSDAISIDDTVTLFRHSIISKEAATGNLRSMVEKNRLTDPELAEVTRMLVDFALMNLADR